CGGPLAPIRIGKRSDVTRNALGWTDSIAEPRRSGLGLQIGRCRLDAFHPRRRWADNAIFVRAHARAPPSCASAEKCQAAQDGSACDVAHRSPGPGRGMVVQGRLAIDGEIPERSRILIFLVQE